mmetsp:Transcript_15723/g.18173  ORF Transcript_15723/g.18173 Transcript_15723/m.18173 type:complete len:80 (-) Transcript_15723:332-571(-)
MRCGYFLHKYKTMKKIEYLRTQAENGNEVYSLASEYLPYPAYIQYHDFYFVKSGFVFHIIESKIKKDHYHKLLKILVKE